MKTFAIDYETYWDTNKEDPCTVVELGNWLYTQHPRFDAYLLSVVGTDGYEWVGHPKDFDWSVLQNQRVVAHNAGFEQAVTEYLRDIGVVPKDFKWAEICDTADMAACLGVPRSLEKAAKYLLGVEVDKGMRDKSKGKRWDEMTPEFQKMLSDYCLDDSRLELRLWLEHNERWNLDEQALSQETLKMCWNGLPIDVPGTRAAIDLLHTKIAEVRKEIPWPDPPLSPKSVKAMCAKHNIDPPHNMAKNSTEFELWLYKHGKKHPWARAMGVYRSMNALCKKIETMEQRTDKNGIHRIGLKYWGGHLGRDSGDSGFNAQNPSRKPMHGVYLRNLMIKAPPGKVLGIVDEGQIEPRVLACLSGDEEKVGLMRQGMDVYEIQARLDKEYDDPRPLKEVSKDIRQYNKVKVLACGYGAGTEKILFIAKKELGLELTFEQGEEIKWKFRSRSYIPNMWKELEWYMKRSKGENYEMELLSGRSVIYRDVQNFGGLSAMVVKGRDYVRLPWWGGSLTENAVQATARDIFMYHVLRIRRELNLKILLRAHDELVTLLDEETAEQDLKNQIAIMSEAPPWMPNYPASADGGLSPVYTKI
jgi:DNA polymerase I-like protein with 3'-5' exonuclease and polymerase domains